MSAPGQYSVAWSGHARADITLSRPRWIAAELTARKVARALVEAGSGYTMQRGRGGWQGGTEAARTFTICSADAAQLYALTQAAVAAAHANGCRCVQVELRTPDGYTVQEWRSA